MAVQASVGRIARAVATAVHDFAATEGWDRRDYAMVATFDPDHDRVYLDVGSVRPVDRTRWTSGIMNNLALAFGSRSSAFYHVVPVVRNLQQLDEIYQHLILTDNDIDLTDLL